MIICIDVSNSVIMNEQKRNKRKKTNLSIPKLPLAVQFQEHVLHEEQCAHMVTGETKQRKE